MGVRGFGFEGSVIAARLVWVWDLASKHTGLGVCERRLESGVMGLRG